MKILLVEDEEIIALMVQSALKKEGYQVLSCSDAQEALRLAENETISLLVSDVNLPGMMNGIALAENVRKIFPSLPVILASGSYDGTQTVHEGLKAFLLPKPFRKSELIEMVQRLLQFPS